MQSGYGASEIQQFMVDGSVHSTLFSISSSSPPNSSPGPHNAAAHELHHSPNAPASNSLKLINPFHHHHHQQQNHHQNHVGKPPPPPPAAVHMEFPHFHSIPITQQLFSRFPHPRHHQLQFQLFHNNPAGYDHHRRLPSSPPFLDPDNHSPTGGAMPSFLAANMNFKLAVDDSSGSGSKEAGLNTDENNHLSAAGILPGDDASESSRFRLWQREEEEEDCAIKEPFWRPLDLDSINRNTKRAKDKAPDDDNHFTKRSREVAGASAVAGDSLENSHPPASGNNYKLFSELEAIYNPKNSTYTGGTYKNPAIAGGHQTTGSGSALTADDHPPPPPAAADTTHNNSSGNEADQNPAKITHRRLRRRKKSPEMFAAFFEGLVKQLMDHQDLLHQKFIDAIERRDSERAGREDAHRAQESARSAREAAGRAQDRALAAARESALISFLEKLTGETLTLPAAHPPQLAAGGGAAAGKTSRWPKAEVQALIAVRSGLEARFQEPGLKGPLWEEVGAAMFAAGYRRSAKRCKEKWENINKYFRKAKYSGKKRSQHSKTCPYFHQLDQLYGSDAPAIAGNRNSELLDAVVDSGVDQQGFDEEEEEEVGESEGRAREEEFVVLG